MGQNLYEAEIGFRIFEIWLSFSLLCRAENEPTLNLSNGIALVVNYQHYVRWRGKHCCPSPCFTLLLWVWMWAEIENGLSCQFLVPSVRFSVRKLKVKILSYLYWKLLLFLAPWIYSNWPEDMHVPSPLHALISSVNETKQTLLTPIPFRHEKRGMTLKITWTLG